MGQNMRTFILGTDWGTDCDDVVAVRLLTRAVKEKKIKANKVKQKSVEE